MKFRFVHKFEYFRPVEYWVGRKYGAIVRVEGNDTEGYNFYVERKQDDFRFNSLWDFMPESYTIPLIRKRLNVTQTEAFAFVEKWVDEYVPPLKKEV
jgi:hypothetical protein